MKLHKAMLFAALAVSSLSLVFPAQAQWNAKQRADFTNDCLDACRKNPKVPEPQRPQCDDYCLCVASEGQKLFNEVQFTQIMKDFEARNQTADVKKFIELAPVCNRKAFAR